MLLRIRRKAETALCLLALAAASTTLLMFAGASQTSAYEGPFCYEEMRAQYEGCSSVQRSSIRRAIGHTIDAYSAVGIETSEVLLSSCYTIECEASTGYLSKDGTGHGYVWNEGPNGARKVSGYLYP